MPKKRVHEIAKEQGITSKEVLQAFKDAGVYVKAASSTVEERDVKRAFPNGAPAKAAPAKAADKGEKPAETADEAPAVATPDRDETGKAKVPRAKAIKGVAKADKAEAPASTQKTRAAGGSAAKAKAPGAPTKPAATADKAADA